MIDSEEHGDEPVCSSFGGKAKISGSQLASVANSVKKAKEEEEDQSEGDDDVQIKAHHSEMLNRRGTVEVNIVTAQKQ